MVILITIRRAGKADANLLSGMVVRLLSELDGAEVEAEPCLQACIEMFDQHPDTFAGFLAFDAHQQCVGAITVSESFSIYAGGRMGIIQELYVLPEYRSNHIGSKLIREVENLARTRGWRRLEVGAPNPAKWERTVSFYKREGFVEIGPRLKKILNEE